ncbi:MAG: hypothetical protein IAE82_17380 [Opitutaceae bacterium]|nr:hypothetical protein [Opitutaceae bacterium]
MLQQSFANLGATGDQARVMAVQLLKRARQIAAERGIPEAAAMRDLLAKVVSGRKGEYTGQPPHPPTGGTSAVG